MDVILFMLVCGDYCDAICIVLGVIIGPMSRNRLGPGHLSLKTSLSIIHWYVGYLSGLTDIA